MTKLSADDDHEMRCCMLVSSSMLLAASAASPETRSRIPHLYSLWIKAVWTILG